MSEAHPLPPTFEAALARLHTIDPTYPHTPQALASMVRKINELGIAPEFTQVEHHQSSAGDLWFFPGKQLRPGVTRNKVRIGLSCINGKWIPVVQKNLKKGFQEGFLDAVEALMTESPRVLLPIWTSEEEEIIVTPLIGGDLHTRYKDRTTRWMSAEEMVLLFVRLARGLKGIHKIGKVHRDIGLPNLGLSGKAEGVVFDLDLMLAADTARSLSPAGSNKAYVPEAVLEGKEKPGPGSDVFALGVVMQALARDVENGMPDEVKILAQHMQASDANKRPTIDLVETELVAAYSTIKGASEERLEDVSPFVQILLQAKAQDPTLTLCSKEVSDIVQKTKGFIPQGSERTGYRFDDEVVIPYGDQGACLAVKEDMSWRLLQMRVVECSLNQAEACAADVSAFGVLGVAAPCYSVDLKDKTIQFGPYHQKTVQSLRRWDEEARALVQSLHKAGFAHGDLRAKNFELDGEDMLSLRLWQAHPITEALAAKDLSDVERLVSGKRDRAHTLPPKGSPLISASRQKAMRRRTHPMHIPQRRPPAQPAAPGGGHSPGKIVLRWLAKGFDFLFG